MAIALTAVRPTWYRRTRWIARAWVHGMLACVLLAWAVPTVDLPAELEPYTERVTLALRINELDIVRETLARAESRLDRLRMEQLRNVAGLQHKE